MRTGIAVSGLVFIAVVVGCAPLVSPPGKACTANYVYGLTVYVTNADTGQPIAATVTALSSQGQTEMLEGSPTGGYVGAGEAPDTYVVDAVAKGYLLAPSQIVTLGFDGCHVIPQTLEFALKPDMARR